VDAHHPSVHKNEGSRMLRDKELQVAFEDVEGTPVRQAPAERSVLRFQKDALGGMAKTVPASRSARAAQFPRGRHAEARLFEQLRRVCLD
jgi:hypothetical protein